MLGDAAEGASGVPPEKHEGPELGDAEVDRAVFAHQRPNEAHRHRNDLEYFLGARVSLDFHLVSLSNN